MDSSVGECANAKGANTAMSCLTGGMHLQSRGLSRIQLCMFEDKVARQLNILKRLGKLPKKGLDIAIKMRLIPRYDRVPGEELTCSKYKNGVTYFERYMSPVCKRQYAHGSCRIIPEKAGICA